MTFNIEYMKKKSDDFWNAYFLLLDLKYNDIGKPIDEVPIVREVDIDEDYLLRAGRNHIRWELVEKLTNVVISEVAEIDIATRAFDLLHTYLDRIVYP